jgi:serine O-acetyltransferase
VLPTDSVFDSGFPDLLAPAAPLVPADGASAAAEPRPVSASVPDWSREYRRWDEWAPAKSLIASVRAYQRHAGRRGPLAFVARRLAVLRHRFWSVVSGADVPLTSRIGGGLVLPHPNGVVIHPDATIGPNCMIFQQVTIGANRGRVPALGGHVDIGAGAKLLGAIRVGDHALIGANAVVLCDVPEGATAVGVPAIVLVQRRAVASPPATEGTPLDSAGASVEDFQ